MFPTYKILSTIYDLIDVIYFTPKGKNPRQAMLEFIPDQEVHILDLCAGTASNSIQIARKRRLATITGVDLSPDMLKIGRQKIQHQGLKNIKLVEADATAVPFETGTVDIVILALVLHEVSPSLAQDLLREARRVLKSTGQLLVLEWELPKTLGKKLLFAPIKWLEPKPFKTFISADKEVYFKNHGFKLIQEEHCDYSCVYKMSKVDQ